MENKFTPGPWEVIRYNDLQYSIYNQGEGYVEKDISDEEDIANAKLIAAAPEMYRLLQDISGSLTFHGDGLAEYTELRDKQHGSYLLGLAKNINQLLKKAAE